MYVYINEGLKTNSLNLLYGSGSMLFSDFTLLGMGAVVRAAAAAIKYRPIWYRPSKIGVCKKYPNKVAKNGIYIGHTELLLPKFSRNTETRVTYWETYRPIYTLRYWESYCLKIHVVGIVLLSFGGFASAWK